MKACPKCGFKPVIRSDEASRHFHAHITQISRESGLDRVQVYFEVLLLAIEAREHGPAAYPYNMVRRTIVSPISGTLQEIDLPEPHRTSACTNAQVATAIEAAHRYAAERGIILHENF